MNAGEAWLIAALALGAAELAVPGFFLIFVAIAAAMTGLTVLAAPALPLAGQLGEAALWSVLAVLIGRRWYRDYPVVGGEPLNDPAARLIGRDVVAETDFVDGRGRVRVADGSWLARSSTVIAIGDRVRVFKIEDGVLVVGPRD